MLHGCSHIEKVTTFRDLTCHIHVHFSVVELARVAIFVDMCLFNRCRRYYIMEHSDSAEPCGLSVFELGLSKCVGLWWCGVLIFIFRQDGIPDC